MLKKLLLPTIFASLSFSVLSIEQSELIDLKQRAAIGDSSAQLLLGQLLLTNKVEKSAEPQEKGIDLILAASKAGNAKATFTLGVLYEKGLLGEVNLSNAYLAYEAAANAGYTKAYVNMGYIAEKQHQIELARELYSKAGANGDSLGYFNLYVFELAQKNKQQAYSALIKAAQAGYANAQYLYGIKLLEMNKQPLNDNSPSILWLKEAMSNGNLDAVSSLMSLYENKTFNSSDLVFLEELMLKSIETGDMSAKASLAGFYIKHHKSYSEAWPLLEQSIANRIQAASSIKLNVLDSVSEIQTQRPLYISTKLQSSSELPILIGVGSSLAVTPEQKDGHVFVIDKNSGAYGFVNTDDLYVNQSPNVSDENPGQEDVWVKSVRKDTEQNVLESNSNKIQKVVARVNRTVNFRAGAHTGSKIKTELHKGDSVTLLSVDQFGWAHVKNGADVGYVMSASLDYDEIN